MRTEVNRNIWMLADDSPSFSQPLKLALPSAPTLRLRAHFIWFTVPLRATHCWFSKRDQSGSWLNGAVGYCRRLSDLEPEHIWGAVQLFTLSTLSVQIQMQAKSNLGTLDFDIPIAFIHYHHVFRDKIQRSLLDDIYWTVGWMCKISESYNVLHDQLDLFTSDWPVTKVWISARKISKEVKSGGKLETGAALVTVSSGQEACAQDLPGLTKSFSINTDLNAGMWERYAKSTQWQTHSQNAFIPKQPNWKVWGQTWQQTLGAKRNTIHCECCLRPGHPAMLLKIQ